LSIEILRVELSKAQDVKFAAIPTPSWPAELPCVVAEVDELREENEEQDGDNEEDEDEAEEGNISEDPFHDNVQ
jgi:hypothetical protein